MSSLDLKYAKHDLGFFSQVEKINAEIKKFKRSNSTAEFTDAHSFEIGRGPSYALFPELLEIVDKGEQVTIPLFRKALHTRGITNIDFQNKILSLVLQNKAGIQYPIGNIVNNLFMNNNHSLLMDRNYKLSLKVDDPNCVKLVFKAVWEDYTTEPRKPSIDVCVEVYITPDVVAINDFKITQISDTPVAHAAYRFLEDNQQNIIEKILSYIKRVFGFNSELRMEEAQANEQCWAPSTP